MDNKIDLLAVKKGDFVVSNNTPLEVITVAELEYAIGTYQVTTSGGGWSPLYYRNGEAAEKGIADITDVIRTS